MTFQDFNLPHELMASVEAMGFSEPTPIQVEAIPAFRAGRDVLANAQTGSGKTAAFLLPIMEDLLKEKRGKTRVLVLAPTRELAIQIAEHFTALAGTTGLTVGAVYGGVGMNPQVAAFRKGVDLIVATPGRLLDHMKQGIAKLPDLRYLVIDEADRMMDMGFLPDMRRILGRLPRQRRTMMFSATLPDPIVSLSQEVLVDPVRISIPSETKAASGITHTVYPISGTLKMDLLLEILKNELEGNVIVFTRTKYRADKVAKFLHKNGIPSDRIHGNRSQAQRNAVLSGFKNYKFRVLVATDLAARGIDVEELRAVVNFDIPNVPEEYIHRVGRTARASATGDALSLVSPEEESDFRAIERHMNARISRKQVSSFNYLGEATKVPEMDMNRFNKLRPGSGKGGRTGVRAGAHAAGPRPGSRGPGNGPGAPKSGARTGTGGTERTVNTHGGRDGAGRSRNEGEAAARADRHGKTDSAARERTGTSSPEQPRKSDAGGARTVRHEPARDPRPEPARKPYAAKSTERHERPKPAGRPQQRRGYGHTAALIPPSKPLKNRTYQYGAADWIEQAVLEAEARKREQAEFARNELKRQQDEKSGTQRDNRPGSR